MFLYKVKGEWLVGNIGKIYSRKRFVVTNNIDNKAGSETESKVMETSEISIGMDSAINMRKKKTSQKFK